MNILGLASSVVFHYYGYAKMPSTFIVSVTDDLGKVGSSWADVDDMLAAIYLWIIFDFGKVRSKNSALS